MAETLYVHWHAALTSMESAARDGIEAARDPKLSDFNERDALAVRARRAARMLAHLAETLELEAP